MEQPPQTDEELVRTFQRGDLQAFGRLIERHQDRLYRLALAWLGNSDFAEDAVQETFLPEFNSLPRFRFGATPFSWLYRILRNICHETNRRQSKLKAFGNAELDVWTDRTEHRAAGEQSLERIRALIAQPPIRQQEVVLPRLFEECTEEETANAMGCRHGTFKVLLYKARQQLQLGLQEERIS